MINTEVKKVTKGKVFIASMNMRGKWADPIDINSIKINVTSAQGKNNNNRINFSPMTEIEGGYKGFYCFENYWQSHKVFEDIPIEKTKTWWTNLQEAKRRYPNSKGKKVLYALYDEEKLDYINSRKKIYVPEYYELIKNKALVEYWKKMLNEGNNLVIYDFDGPRTETGDVTCLELTETLLIEKINYLNQPFGHGYVVAACIAGFSPDKYIN
jgi:hypothetical protein